MAFQVVSEFIGLDMIEMYFVRFLIQQILLALSPISGPSMFYGCCCLCFKEIILELYMFKAVMLSVMMNVCTFLTAG